MSVLVNFDLLISFTLSDLCLYQNPCFCVLPLHPVTPDIESINAPLYLLYLVSAEDSIDLGKYTGRSCAVNLLSLTAAGLSNMAH